MLESFMATPEALAILFVGIICVLFLVVLVFLYKIFTAVDILSRRIENLNDLVRDLAISDFTISRNTDLDMDSDFYVAGSGTSLTHDEAHHVYGYAAAGSDPDATRLDSGTDDYVVTDENESGAATSV